MTFHVHSLYVGIIFCILIDSLSFAQEEVLYENGVRINNLTNKDYLKKTGTVAPLPIEDAGVQQASEVIAQPQNPILDDFETEKTNKDKTHEEELVTAYKGRFSLMAFYTASMGNFKETATNGNSIETEQNSPLTLGLFGNYRPHLAHYSWQGSAYSSKLKGSQTTYAQQVDPPNELGANLYWQYEIRAMAVSFGADFERFSNYSAESMDANGVASIKNQNVTFATVGIGRFIPISSWNLLAKLSVSTSIAKSDFGGQKGILYLGLFSPWKWQVHALYKLHKLENDSASELTIGRFGVGVGYLFL